MSMAFAMRMMLASLLKKKSLNLIFLTYIEWLLNLQNVYIVKGNHIDIQASHHVVTSP